MDNNNQDRRKHEGRIIAGLILICVGASFLLRNTGFPVPGWLFTWPMILIAVGIYSGAKHNFRNNSWIILIGIGTFFLFDRFIPGLHLGELFWPLIIIGIGILFIIRPDRRKWREEIFDQNKTTDATDATWTGTVAGSEMTTDSNDELVISSVFSGVQRKIITKNFQGGKASCVFGGADIDFSQAEISGKVMVKFEVVFGGVKLIVPPHWAVVNEINGVFHGVDDKRKYNTNATVNPEKILLLKGDVVFGGIEIKSY